MKIISKFRDYYDTLVDQYGVDEKIVFNRTIELPTCVRVHVPDEQVLQIPPYIERNERKTRFCLGSYLNYYERAIFENIGGFCYVVVCGKSFLLCYEEGEYQKYKVVSDTMLRLIMNLPSFRSVPPLTEPRKYLEKVAKEIHSPIFFVRGYSNPTIEKLSQDVYEINLAEVYIKHTTVPCLADLTGFAKAYPAEQLYQDISYWVANVMNESPDLQPSGRPPQSDKEKIASHGLDVKQSFRHRKD